MDGLKGLLIPRNVYDLIQLTGEGRLTLVDSFKENIFPGINLLAAYDTHTFGCQYVMVTNESGEGKGPWVFVGDNLYSYKNIEGIHGDNVYLPIGFCQCDTIKTILSIDEIMQYIKNNKKRLILFHAEESWSIFPSWQGVDGLYVAEVCLAPGVKSLFPK